MNAWLRMNTELGVNTELRMSAWLRVNSELSVNTEPAGCEAIAYTGCYVVDSSESVDLDDDATFGVDRDDGLGLLAVEVLTVTNHVFGVVDAALFERALREALDDLVGVGLQLDDGVELGAAFGEDAI